MKNAMSKNRLAKFWFENSSRFRSECLQILQQKNLFVSNCFWAICGDDIKAEILSLKEIKPWKSDSDYLTQKAKNMLETLEQKPKTESVEFSDYGEYVSEWTVQNRHNYGRTTKRETIHVMLFGDLMVNRCYLKSLFRIVGVRMNQCEFATDGQALHVFHDGKKLGHLMGIEQHKFSKNFKVKVGEK